MNDFLNKLHRLFPLDAGDSVLMEDDDEDGWEDEEDDYDEDDWEDDEEDDWDEEDDEEGDWDEEDDEEGDWDEDVAWEDEDRYADFYEQDEEPIRRVMRAGKRFRDDEPQPRSNARRKPRRRPQDREPSQDFDEEDRGLQDWDL